MGAAERRTKDQAMAADLIKRGIWHGKRQSVTTCDPTPRMGEIGSAAYRRTLRSNIHRTFKAYGEIKPSKRQSQPLQSVSLTTVECNYTPRYVTVDDAAHWNEPVPTGWKFGRYGWEWIGKLA